MICWEREGRNEKLEIREENRRKDGKEGEEKKGGRRG